MAAGFLDKRFNKTILLRPTAEGVLEPIDITGQDKVFINELDSDGNQHAVEIRPTRIYQVRKLRGIKRICIHDYNTTQLIDLYNKNQDSTMSEKILADLLDISYQKGQKEAGSGGEMNKQLFKSLRIIMAIAAVAVAVSVMVYFKVN